MSSRASKYSDHGSQGSSDFRSSVASKRYNNSLGSRSSAPHQQREQGSSSMQITDSNAARASSPRLPQPSNTNTVSESTSDGRHASSTADLLEVSAWAYHSQGTFPDQDLSNQFYNDKQASTCQYHASEMSSDHDTAWSGYGLAPLERWLDEDVGHEGVVALQLGHQLRVDCNCVAMQGEVGINE